jgi:CRP-like cAMP-binding protein
MPQENVSHCRLHPKPVLDGAQHAEDLKVHHMLAGTRLARSNYLSDGARRALERAARARSIRPRFDFVREGEKTDDLYIVSSGWAYRYKTTREGNRQIVALLLPGDVANIDSFLFDRLDYGICAIAPLKVLTVSRARLCSLAERHGDLVTALAWLAFVENAAHRQWALCLGRQSAKQRLAHLFCELSKRLGSGENGGSFELPLTQEHIGDVLGLTAVHVNRMVQSLRAEGLIEIGGRTLTIIDADQLCRAGNFDPAYLHSDYESFAIRTDRTTVHENQAAHRVAQAL